MGGSGRGQLSTALVGWWPHPGGLRRQQVGELKLPLAGLICAIGPTASLNHHHNNNTDAVAGSISARKCKLHTIGDSG